MRIARLAAFLLLLACGSAAATGFDGGSLARAAVQQVGVTVNYDPMYRKLAYPNGDVPRDRGVCTDVVVRAFRAIGVDLQQKVHEDMSRNFAAYPGRWVDHIGVVSTGRGSGARPLVVHNIGRGAQEEDVLFAWTLTGQYRWFK